MAKKPKKYSKKVFDINLDKVNTLPGHKELFGDGKKSIFKENEEIVQEMVEEVFEAMMNSGKVVEIVTIKIAFHSSSIIEEEEIEWSLDRLARKLLPDDSRGTFEIKGASREDSKGTTLIMKMISDKVNLAPLLASLLEIVLEEEFTLEAIEILSGRALKG